MVCEPSFSPIILSLARVSFSVGGTVFSGRSETRATSPFTARGGDGLEAARATRRPRREHVMSGAKLRTEKAVNSVMADQTIETELAQLVSEYLQHHRCERAYEVHPSGRAPFPSGGIRAFAHVQRSHVPYLSKTRRASDGTAWRRHVSRSAAGTRVRARERGSLTDRNRIRTRSSLVAPASGIS